MPRCAWWTRRHLRRRRSANDPTLPQDLDALLDGCVFPRDVREMCYDTSRSLRSHGTRLWTTITFGEWCTSCRSARWVHSPRTPQRRSHSPFRRERELSARGGGAFRSGALQRGAECDEDGTYRFRASRAAVHALARRRLELADGALATRRMAASTVRRPVQVRVQSGFSVRGDCVLFPWDAAVRHLDAGLGVVTKNETEGFPGRKKCTGCCTNERERRARVRRIESLRSRLANSCSSRHAQVAVDAALLLGGDARITGRLLGSLVALLDEIHRCHRYVALLHEQDCVCASRIPSRFRSSYAGAAISVFITNPFIFVAESILVSNVVVVQSGIPVETLRQCLQLMRVFGALRTKQVGTENFGTCCYRTRTPRHVPFVPPRACLWCRPTI